MKSRSLSGGKLKLISYVTFIKFKFIPGVLIVISP